MDDGDYDFNKRPDKTYMSTSLPDLDSSGRRIRIAKKIFGAVTEPEFATVKANWSLGIRRAKNGSSPRIVNR